MQDSLALRDSVGYKLRFHCSSSGNSSSIGCCCSCSCCCVPV